MKETVIFLITLYQALSPFRGNCRFYPTCSSYAKIVIREHGIIKGGWLTFLRLLSCQPFATQNYKVNLKSHLAKSFKF